MHRTLDLLAESSEALAVLGRAELLDRNRDQAGQLLSKAVENGPNDAVALTYYGEYLMSEARPQDAAPGFEKARRLDPLSEQTLFGLANLYLALRRGDEAEEIIAKVNAVNPDSANSSSLKSVIPYMRGEYATAILYMIEAHENDPDDPEPAGQVALMYLTAGMPDEAKRWFDRAVEINPDHPMARASQLFVYYHTRVNKEQNVQLARELLNGKIENRGGSRGIALQVLYSHSLESDNLDSFLEVLDNLYPHLFDDPPHDLDRSWMGVFFVGMTLVNNGDAERGAALLQAGQDRRDKFESAYDIATRRGIDSRLMLGDRDAALQRLAHFSQDMIFSDFDYTMFRYDPVYEPIRDEPSFVALLKRYEENAAEQRQLLQAMNAD